MTTKDYQLAALRLTRMSQDMRIETVKALRIQLDYAASLFQKSYVESGGRLITPEDFTKWYIRIK